MMPKKEVDDRTVFPPRSVWVLNEALPHTLAEFIEESMRHGIFPERLPEGIGAEEAGERFGAMSQVMLRPLSPVGHYFYGFFPDGGKPVITDDGKLLFTIFTELMGGGIGHRLRIEPAARELLLGVVAE